MSRLNHSPLCGDCPPPPSSPHLQCWSLAHVLAVYHSRRRETHRAVMDGPGAKTAPIAYQLPISTHLAGCQCAPRPIQVNEIRCKCRYNGAFCRVQITQCQLGCPPVGSVSRWMRERVWEVCVGLLMCVCVCGCRTVCMSWGNQVISQTHLPSGGPAASLFICATFDCWPHILCHLSVNPAGWFVPHSQCCSRRWAVQSGRRNWSPHRHANKHNHTFSHTQMRWFRWLALPQLCGP